MNKTRYFVVRDGDVVEALTRIVYREDGLWGEHLDEDGWHANSRAGIYLTDFEYYEPVEEDEARQIARSKGFDL